MSVPVHINIFLLIFFVAFTGQVNKLYVLLILHCLWRWFILFLFTSKLMYVTLQ